MIQKIKYWLPALIAVVMLSFLAMLDLLRLINTQENTLANFFNVILLLIALFDFFVFGLPSRKNGECNTTAFCGAIAISAIAFPMNIDIFKYTLLLEELPENLWGWHTGWIIMIVVQALLLTRIGSTLLDAVKWAVNKLGKTYTCIENWVKDNRRLVLLILGGLIFWSIFSVAQFFSKNVVLVFSDIDFWMSSTKIWIKYFIIVLCAYILWMSFPKIGEAIKNMKGISVLAAALVIVIAALTNVLPSFLQILATVISFPTMTMGAIVVSIKALRPKPAPNTANQKREINSKDAVVMLFSFVGLPLSFLFLITLLETANGETVVQDPSNISAWLNFFSSVAEVASNLFKWFM